MTHIPKQPDYDAMIKLYSITQRTAEHDDVSLTLYAFLGTPVFVLDRVCDGDDGVGRWAMVDGEPVLIVNDGNPQISFSYDDLRELRHDIDTLLQAWDEYNHALDALDTAAR